MKQIDSKLEIRILRHENHLSEYPDNWRSCYCLGAIYAGNGNLGLARRYLEASLDLCGNIYAVLALIKLDVLQNRYLSGIHRFQKYNDIIRRKGIYIPRLQYLITSLYKRKGSLSYSRLIPVLAAHKLKLIDPDSSNEVLSLLKLMHSLETKDESPGFELLAAAYIKAPGINDNFRWLLIKRLSCTNPYILSDNNAASCFRNIPAGCTSDFANMIFSNALNKGSFHTIRRIFRQLEAASFSIKNQLLWKYVNYCTESDAFNDDVYNCCKRLLRAGWIDKTVAGAMLNVIRNGSVTPSEKELGLLSLYGYASYVK